jgi:hypothetical protein
MMRNFLRTLGTSRNILIALGVALWILASRNQIGHGWFAPTDFWLMAAGSAVFAAALLPGVIRVNLPFLRCWVQIAQLKATLR